MSGSYEIEIVQAVPGARAFRFIGLNTLLCETEPRGGSAGDINWMVTLVGSWVVDGVW